MPHMSLPGRIVPRAKAPKYLHRRYIERGYYVEGGYAEAVRNAFNAKNNECGNVVTMLVGCMAAAGIYFYTESYRVYPSYRRHFLFLSCALHTPFSVLLHTLIGMSERTRNVLRCLDVLMIQICSLLKSVALSRQPLHPLHTFALILLAAAAIINAKTLTWRSKASLPRLLMPYIFAGLFPMWFIFFTRSLNTQLIFAAPLATALYLTAAIIYAAAIPERWKPGAFDLFGNSHQLMHLFGFLGHFVEWWFLLTIDTALHNLGEQGTSFS